MGKDQELWSFEMLPNETLKLTGEIDFAVTPQVRQKLLDHVKQSEGTVNIDLSELSYLDSAGLALFIELRRVLQDQDREVKILSIHPQVKKLFTLTQVGPLFGL